MGNIQSLASITAPVGNIGAGTDPLMSAVIGANVLGLVNDGFYAFAEGFVSAQDGGAGDTRTLNWTYAGQALDTRVINGVNALCFWRAEIWIFRVATPPNNAHFFSKFEAWNSGVDTAPIRSFGKSGLIAVNHGVANTLAFTGASSDAVNDDVVQNILTAWKIPGA